MKPQAAADIQLYKVPSRIEDVLVISHLVWDNAIYKAPGDEGIHHVYIHSITISPSCPYPQFLEFVKMGKRAYLQQSR